VRTLTPEWPIQLYCGVCHFLLSRHRHKPLQVATLEAGGGSAGGADAESDPLAAVLAMMTAEERALWNAIQSVPTGPAPSVTGTGRRGGGGDGVVLAV